MGSQCLLLMSTLTFDIRQPHGKIFFNFSPSLGILKLLLDLIAFKIHPDAGTVKMRDEREAEEPP